MDFRPLVFLIALNCLTYAFPHDGESNQSRDYTVSFNDEGKHLSTHGDVQQKTLDIAKTMTTDKPKSARYEVTELVIDIPDNRTRGPIFPNFSVNVPLNTASGLLTTTEAGENVKTTVIDSYTNKVLNADKNATGKRNCINILHVKAEYDDEIDKDKIDASDFDFGNVPHFSGIKEYFNGIKRGIVNGFTSIIHKNGYKQEEHQSHESSTGPFNFFNKIHRKSSNFAQKIHNHIFGDEEVVRF